MGNLASIRNRFGAAARPEKLRLLAALASRPPTTAAAVRRHHDTLLFLAAHPDGPDVLAAAEAGLAQIAALVAARPPLAAALADSGIAGTDVYAEYTCDTLGWLTRRFPDDVEVDWDDETAGTGLDRWLRECVPVAERDGFYELGDRAWIEAARGDGGGTDLAWLLERFATLPLPPGPRDHVFDTITLPVTWTLRDVQASITGTRFPPRRPHYFRDDLQRVVDLPAVTRRSVPDARPLPPAQARRLIETARVTLACRGRETDPVTHANPAEVVLVPLERGIDVALFGLEPSRRLPLETFVGYIAARNRVPLAYGGAWMFGDRAEIGINVFDSFRGGESALLFAQLMRVYRQRFDVRRFAVDPFQIGDDNADGIRSGAYWFYYKLGFRPADPALATLAAEHFAALRTRRTPPGVLRRLARGGLQMKLGRTTTPTAPRVQDVALAVTRGIATRFGGDRAVALRRARRVGAGLATAATRRRWTDAERRGFEDMTPLVALFDDLDRWPAKDRRDLASLMRARGGLREHDYLRRVQRHPRFLASLRRLVDAAG